MVKQRGGWLGKWIDGWLNKEMVAKYRQKGDLRDKWVAKKRDGRPNREMGG